jgi:hypothetical protein
MFLWLLSIMEQKINCTGNKLGQLWMELASRLKAEVASRLKAKVQDKIGTAVVKNEAGKKALRGAILYIQLLCACFFLGQYFMWSPQSKTPQGGVLCTLFARSTLSIFYKPLVPTMWYGLAHLLDNQGWMLHHTVFTDTLVGLVQLIFGAWCVLAFVVALPVLVCYFYLVLPLVLPLATYTWVQRELLFEVALHVVKTANDRDERMKNIKSIAKARGLMEGTLPDEDKTDYGVAERTKIIKSIVEARGLVYSPAAIAVVERDASRVLTAAVAVVERDASRVLMVWNRLVLLCILVATVLSITLWPFYLGRAYIDVLTSAASHLSLSFEFWELGWWSGFGWPDKLPLPDQIVLGVSLGTLGAEQIVKLLLDLLAELAPDLLVDSHSLWGGWRNYNRATGNDQLEQTEELEEEEKHRLDAVPTTTLAAAPQGEHPSELGLVVAVDALYLTPDMVDVPPKLAGLSPTIPLREIGKLKELRSGSSDLPDNMRFMI